MKVGDLFIELGIMGNALAFNNAGTAVTALNTTFLALKEGIESVYDMLDKLSSKTLDTVTQFYDFNQQTGLSIQKLIQWQTAAAKVNPALTADNVMGSIHALQKTLTQYRLGGGDTFPVKVLGLDVYGSDAFETLDKVREAIKRIDPSMVSNLISRIGIDPSMITLLKMTREEFEALASENILSDEDVKRLAKFNIGVNTIRVKIGLFLNQITARLEPLLSRITEWLETVETKYNVGDRLLKTAEILVSVLTPFLDFCLFAIERIFLRSAAFIDMFKRLYNYYPLVKRAVDTIGKTIQTIVNMILLAFLVIEDIEAFATGREDSLSALVASNLNKIFSQNSLFDAVKIAVEGAGRTLHQTNNFNIFPTGPNNAGLTDRIQEMINHANANVDNGGQ